MKAIRNALGSSKDKTTELFVKLSASTVLILAMLL